MKTKKTKEAGHGVSLLTASPESIVDVVADYGRDGSITPRTIEWSDGKAWPIERIAAVQPGGQFLRFTCQVREQWLYLLLPARLVG